MNSILEQLPALSDMVAETLQLARAARPVDPINANFDARVSLSCEPEVCVSMHLLSIVFDTRH
jgi:hypothetical protein